MDPDSRRPTEGGTAADVALGFHKDGSGAIVDSLRGIIFAYQSPRYAGLAWQEAVAEGCA